jgi:hypothetical protein
MSKKTLLLWLIVASVLIAGSASAAPERLPQIQFDQQGNPAGITPYVEITPLGPLRMDGLGTTVFFIFAADCSFSRSIHDRVMAWGQTLPSGWNFVPVHAFSPGYGAVMPIVFAARSAQRRGGGFDEVEFWELLYAAVQSGQKDPENFEHILSVAVRAGADERDTRRAFTEQAVHRSVQTMGDVMIRYKPERVPALIIGDRFMTHPDLTGDLPTSMFQVSNALISILIHERRRSLSQEDPSNGENQ